ncbi:hypothetical protein KJ780_03610 [Candidatus Micrarchaeota archaeon]|nr:hypothetical protein [Candidatus Micrarchaeota archaeon]
MDLSIGVQDTLDQLNNQYLGLHPTTIYLLESSLLFVFASILIYFIFRSLSKRDLFNLDLSSYRDPKAKWKSLKAAVSVISYLFEYGIVFPAFAVFWFSIISLSLFLLSAESSYYNVLFTTAVIVGSVRMMAYVKEALAVDVAKILPFLLLTTVILNPSFLENNSKFSLDIWSVSQADYLTFFSFIVVLEWSLRVLYILRKGIIRITTGKKEVVMPIASEKGSKD